MIDFTEAALRESALRYAVDCVDPETQPTAGEVLTMAQAFESYLRGEDVKADPAQEDSEPEAAAEVPCNCPICRPGGLRDLIKTQRFLAPHMTVTQRTYPGRSAG